MADLQRTIDIIFAGTDNLSPTLSTMGNNLSAFESAIGRKTQPLADLTGDIFAAEAAVVAFAGAMGGLAITEAGKFQTSVSEIGTLFTGTEAQVKALGDEILEYSQNSTQSIEAINAAVYQAISTGTSYAEAVQFVADAEQLATGGRADLAAVTDVLASSMNAYGAEASQASDYTDVLFTAVQKGKTSIPELAASLSQVTGIASAANVPFGDLNAALAAITASGDPTSQAATKIKAVLTELLKPSTDLSAALGDVSLESDGLEGVMTKLKEVTGGNAAEMGKLFGSTEALQAALLLANDNAGKFEESLQAMEERAGATKTAFEQMRGEFENINQNLLNNIQVTFAKAGEPLLDNYSNVLGELSGLFQAVSFEFDSGTFQPLYDGLDDAEAKITEVLSGIAEALPAAMDQVKFEPLLDAFGELGGSLGDLFGDLDLTQPDDLTEAIQVIINGVASLTNITSSAVDGIKPFIQTIVQLVDKFNESGDGLQDLIGYVSGFGAGVNAILPAMGFLADGLILLGGIKGFAGLLGKVGSTTGAIKTLLAVAGAGGLLTLAGLSVIEIGKWADSVGELSDQIDKNNKAVDIWNKALNNSDNWGETILNVQKLGGEVGHLAEEFERQYGITIDQASAFDSLDEALASHKASSEAAATAAAEEAKAREEGALAIRTQTNYYDEQVKSAWAAIQTEGELKKWHIENTKALQSLTEAQIAELDAQTLATLQKSEQLAQQNGWLKALDEEKAKTGELVKSKEALAQARQNAHEQQLLEMELAAQIQQTFAELASNENIRATELAFDLDIAELEAETKRALGVFDTLNTAIDSTAQLTGDLWGTLADSDLGFSDKWALQDAIDAEEDRRAKAFEQQQKLTEEQIKQVTAQTELAEQRARAISRGDASIRIDGAGLEPHLEAFMWEILKAIQVRVNAEGHAMLLGE
ncbi:MAG: phage tail tape measure protein [Oceanospirillaceae bacterium]|nr:phage tail tape measure protein [Oceanospirillaceae bacterium]